MEPEVQNNEPQKNQDNASIGWGIAALILGIISIVFIYYIIISVLAAVLAIVFGFIAMRRNDKMGKAGLILGVISVLITFLLFIFLQVLDVSLFTIPSWYR